MRVPQWTVKLKSVCTVLLLKQILIRCNNCMHVCLYQLSSVFAQMIVDVNDSTEGTAHSLTQGDVRICSSNQQTIDCLTQKRE